MKGVCDTPLRFSCDAETNGFLHLDLRNCFTINDEFANGEHLFTGRQWCFRDRKQWIESRAKSICHLRNEDCFMRKTAIVTAIMKLSLAQTLIATAIMKLSLAQTLIATAITKLSLAQTPIATAIMKLSLAQTLIATAIMKLSLAQTLIATTITKLSLRHRCLGNRDGTLYTVKSLSPHLRWKHCRQNKRLEATAK